MIDTLKCPPVQDPPSEDGGDKISSRDDVSPSSVLTPLESLTVTERTVDMHPHGYSRSQRKTSGALSMGMPLKTSKVLPFHTSPVARRALNIVPEGEEDPAPEVAWRPSVHAPVHLLTMFAPETSTAALVNHKLGQTRVDLGKPLGLGVIVGRVDEHLGVSLGLGASEARGYEEVVCLDKPIVGDDGKLVHEILVSPSQYRPYVSPSMQRRSRRTRSSSSESMSSTTSASSGSSSGSPTGTPSRSRAIPSPEPSRQASPWAPDC